MADSMEAGNSHLPLRSPRPVQTQQPRSRPPSRLHRHNRVIKRESNLPLTRRIRRSDAPAHPRPGFFLCTALATRAAK
jgi:hypothetical protein